MPGTGARTGRKGPRNAPPPAPGEPFANQLLGILPPATLDRINTHLDPVYLERRTVLFRAHEPLRTVYFPTTAVVSLVVRLETGQMLEVGVVGRDGLAGTAGFPVFASMPCDGIVQLSGHAYRMSADVLRGEVLHSEALGSVIARFSQTLHVRCMHMAACNMFHPVEQRCIRWLLTISDLIDTDHVPLTHELLATMLGVHRPTVTVVIRSLHRAGLVDEKRGRIVIKNHDRLVAACCECYSVMRDEQRGLLGY